MSKLTPSPVSGLVLQLFGSPQVTRDGRPLSGFRSSKARALLFYVATTDQPQGRTKLAGLLWGELPEQNANANLRKTLTNLRQVAGSYLAISRETVSIAQNNAPWLDVRTFETALDQGDAGGLRTAVDLYAGDFLDGFYVQGAPAFEQWMLAERYRLRERLLAALKRLAEVEARRGELRAAIHCAHRLLALEPLREDAHRLLMTLLAQNGQRARALAQYETCTAILAGELGVEPGDETTALFKQIRDGDFAAPAAEPPHNLPAPVTSFVGREQSLAEAERWLADGSQRLLTITGPGGVGKTRLAQQAAWKALDSFAAGVWNISLTSLEDAYDLPNLVASSLGISFVGKGSPQDQVVRYLRRKALLLLLDNAEHLLSQALSDFLTAILTQAPNVRIMVTSRQRLHMQAEQVMILSGLAYPRQEPAGAAGVYPAGQLFLQRAEGHGQRLPDTAPVNQAILRVCRLVEGLPLALELAASWTPDMSVSQIEATIRRDLDHLATDLHDVPARHRSMRAVFEASWRLLEHDERRVMRRLSYFRGGFSAQHAVEVVPTTVAQLQALVDKSLVRRQPAAGEHKRYEMHELLRQFAAEKLAQDPDEVQALARRHGQTFAAFLAAREAAMRGPDYLQAKSEIQTEIDNVRKAWEWAVHAGSLPDVVRAAETLHDFFLNTQGLFAEAAERFERAALHISAGAGAEGQRLVGDLLLKAAANRRMLGQLQAASRLAEQSLDIFYRHELGAGIARASSTLAVIRLQQNDKERALRLAETAVAEAREMDEPIDLCLCLNNLAYVVAHNGDYEAAVAAGEESLALARDTGFPHGELSALNMLGVHYQWLGEEGKAQRIFEELVARCRQAATESRLAQAVNNLGAHYHRRGLADKAQPLLQEAARLYDRVGQVHYAAFVGVLMGELALEAGDEEAAHRYCLQAMDVARDIELAPLALDALLLFAQMRETQGRTEDAVSMLALVANHEATLGTTMERAQEMLRAFQESLSSRAFEAAAEKGAAWKLQEGVRRVMLPLM